MSIHYFSGTAKWAKVNTPDEYNGETKWSINLYLSTEELKRLKSTGVKLKVREDEEGKFVTFKRPTETEWKGEQTKLEAPKLYQGPVGEEISYEGEIGNGSECTVKINVYDTRMGKGHRLEAVRIDKLVEYTSREGF